MYVLIILLAKIYHKNTLNPQKQAFGKYPGRVLLFLLCGSAILFTRFSYIALLLLSFFLQLPQVEIRDRPHEGCTFELIEKNTGNTIVLTAHRDHIKDFWLKEIREFASETST